MHRILLKKSLKAPCFRTSKYPTTLRVPKHMYSKPVIPLYCTLGFHHVDKTKAIRIGSEKSPATPSQIEFVESQQVSNYKLVRIAQSIIRFIDQWVLEPILTLHRFAHILVLFIPVAVTVPIVYFGQKVDKEDTTGTLWWYDFLATQMERAGPTFIKLAQWVASRTDLFPLALCARLSKLHSNVDPHPFSYTKQVIEEAFGRPLGQVFTELDPVPLGVGAIAQVYKARLRPNVLLNHSQEQFTLKENIVTSDSVQVLDKEGKPIVLHTAVAIKVLHPKARQIVQRDLIIMQYCAKLLTLIPTIHWLSLPDEVRVFGEMMKEQLDLRGEADNLKRFNKDFKGSYNVKFPKPLAAFSTKDMLLEEHEKGIPLDLFLKQASWAREHDVEGVFDHKIADIGLNAFLHMLIFYNFVHADLHPGNIMVEFYKPSAYHPLRLAWSKLIGNELVDDGELAVNRILAVKEDADKLQNELEALDKEGYSPRLVFIDTGLVNELNEVNRRNFLDLFQAIAKFDGYRTGELMVERCKSPELVIHPDVFALRMQNLILGLKQNTFHLGAVKIGNLLHETMNMVRSHHVRLEGDFVNIVVSIMLLEGIGRQLNPDLDLLKNALPVLRDYSIKEGGKVALENIKYPQANGHWIKVWIFLELRNYLGRNTRDEEWLQLCDILCPNI
ncbi:ABC1-domain-containing protein [Helicostylum pulchrum]|nr:ABC1-domain-containing protein [Helicostylum pulchrum]